MLALPASPVLFSSTGVCNTDSLNINNSASPELVLRCPKVSSVTSGGVLQFSELVYFQFIYLFKKDACHFRRFFLVDVSEEEELEDRCHGKKTKLEEKLQVTEN